MSQQNIPIQPNIVTTVNMALQAGATLYNADPDSAIWVNSSPGVAPNSGMRIGPKGSLQWSKGGSPCYACLDAGVTDSVSLSVSTDISNLVNPVDIGVAVATQLLAQGVPSVLIGETVYTGPVTMPVPGAEWVLPVSVGSYASVILNITSTENQRLTLSWRDNGTGQTVVSESYILAALPLDVNSLVLQLSVKSDELVFWFTNTTATVTLNAYASNRSLPDKVVAPPFYATVIPNQAYAAFQTVSFPQVFTTSGGMRTIHLTPNGVGAAGYFGLNLLTTLGAAQSVTLLDTSKAAPGASNETELTENVNLPAGQYIPWWQNGPAPQTYPVNIAIT